MCFSMASPQSLPSTAKLTCNSVDVDLNYACCIEKNQYLASQCDITCYRLALLILRLCFKIYFEDYFFTPNATAFLRRLRRVSSQPPWNINMTTTVCVIKTIL